MRIHNLKINQLSNDAFAWYQRYLTALDEKALESYGTFFADDATLQMNNAEPMKGKKQILAGLAQYWPSFVSLEHDLLTIYGTDHAFVLEALNHYHRLDGDAVTLRAVAFTDRNEQGLVTSSRIYTDTTPLFAPKA